MRGLSVEEELEAARREGAVGRHGRFRAGVEHNRRVDLVEGAGPDHVDLATGVLRRALFGRRAEHPDRAVKLAQHLRERQAGSERRRGDQVVTATVPEPRQGVVLGEHGHGRPTGAAGQDGFERRFHPGRAHLDIGTGRPQDGGQSDRRLVLLVAKLGVGVNPIGGLDQVGSPPVDGRAHALLQCIKVWHRPALVGRPACA